MSQKNMRRSLRALKVDDMITPKGSEQNLSTSVIVIFTNNRTEMEPSHKNV